jgi:hypothetical protein
LNQDQNEKAKVLTRKTDGLSTALSKTKLYDKRDYFTFPSQLHLHQ